MTFDTLMSGTTFGTIVYPCRLYLRKITSEEYIWWVSNHLKKKYTNNGDDLRATWISQLSHNILYDVHIHYLVIMIVYFKSSFTLL